MNKEFLSAYEILAQVYLNKTYVNIALHESLSGSTLNHKIITKIVYGVLEKDITLEYFLKDFFQKQPKPKVKIIFKMAAYMHLFLNSIPNFAIANELVQIVKVKIDAHQSGFANAIIKKILSSSLNLNGLSGTKLLSIKHSYPEFVIKSLLKNNSKEFVEEFLSTKISNNTIVRVNEKEISAKQFENYLLSNGVEFNKTTLENAYAVNYESLLKLEENSTKYFVQGIPSQVVVKSLNVKNGSNILDLCAAPGGKSVYASLLYNSSVTACDIHEHRIKLIESYAKKYGANVSTTLNDACKVNPNFINKFNCVMLDVPCSGTGVLNKKPDAMLSKTYADVLNLAEIQKTMLQAASKYVCVGGILNYSTCSIMHEENEDVINWFLKNNKNFKIEKIKVNQNVVNRNELITFYPNVSGTEGFFIGRLKKYE